MEGLYERTVAYCSLMYQVSEAYRKAMDGPWPGLIRIIRILVWYVFKKPSEEQLDLQGALDLLRHGGIVPAFDAFALSAAWERATGGIQDRDRFKVVYDFLMQCAQPDAVSTESDSRC
jgi:hypothetical protein